MVRGKPVVIPRHIVVATRVNANGVKPKTRRMQIRAWNSQEAAPSRSVPIEIAVDIATAHLFGFLRNLRLPRNAQALAWARWRWPKIDPQDPYLYWLEDLNALWKEADVEFRGLASSESTNAGDVRLFRESDFGRIEIELSQPLMALTRALQRAENFNDASTALLEADRRLDEWQKRATAERENRSLLPFGVAMRFPAVSRKGRSSMPIRRASSMAYPLQGYCPVAFGSRRPSSV